jgi:CRISPR-associated protein Csm2
MKMADNMKDAFRNAGLNISNPREKKKATQPKHEKDLENDVFQDYTARAESVIKELKNNERQYRIFTTSKIRNILAMVNEIYNDVQAERDEILSENIQERILHLKVRLVYECGREEIIKKFYDKAGLEKMISDIGNSRKKFIAFARYMEALVAYHLFYGGSDR